jgi:hypothetical protein
VALYALLAVSVFTTVYDPLPNLTIGVDVALLALPSLGLGLATGRFSAAAVPFLVLAPWALAGDDGSNAFAYRLPALAIGLLALASAVLVLTGVLLRTSRRPITAWLGVAFLLFSALPLLWAGYRQLVPLDKDGDLVVADAFHGGFKELMLGDHRSSAIIKLGLASPSRSDLIAPVGEDFDHIGGPPFIATPGSTHEVLRYPATSVLLSDDRVYGFVITHEDAETAGGVGVGDNLGLAEEKYAGLDCGIARAGEYRTFPYCGGRVDAMTWIWFGQDPIRSIVLTSSELGPE